MLCNLRKYYTHVCVCENVGCESDLEKLKKCETTNFVYKHNHLIYPITIDYDYS